MEQIAAALEALSAQPAEPVALIAAAVERVRNTIIVEGESPEELREAIALRVADVGKPTFVLPQPAPSVPAVPEGCACRWDADDKRVQTCERHQGWLDVIAEWADRARAAEAALAAARHPAAKGGEPPSASAGWHPIGTAKWLATRVIPRPESPEPAAKGGEQ